MYHRRGYQVARRHHGTIIDVVLLLVLLLSLSYATFPLVQDLASDQKSRRVISQMTSVSDNTMDPRRKSLLREAQAYNGTLAEGEGHVDNAGMRGGNGGSEDILSLAEPGEEPTLAYECQLSEEPTQPLCWIEVPAASVAEPVYHTTTDEVLAQGVGHLASSSLPVGGTSSHCVLAGHSGMENAHMFDHLGEVSPGDVIILHTLGDAYWYEIFQTEVVTPREAEHRCAIVDGEDLCTLVTCTPYGINSHRLLVHARRVAAQSLQLRNRSAYRLIVDHRTAPPLALAGFMAVPLAAGLLGRLRHHVKDGKEKKNKLPGRFDRRRNVVAGRPETLPRVMRPYDNTASWSATFSSRGATKTGAHHVWLWRLGVPLGTILCVSAAAVAGHLAQEGTGYRRLEQQIVLDRTAKESGVHMDMPTIDWTNLRDINPETAAWVRVTGTDISLPVVAPSDGDMVFYLRHNLWKQWSLQGTPFLDHRSEADGSHRVVYGHHLSSGGQFSQLQHSYEQTAFDALGTCHWSTPQRQDVTFVPLCALSVDQWYEGIQRFSFTGDDELREWLIDLCEDASARARDWREVVGGAESALTLVTCSSELSNQPWRTLVVFVEVSTTPRSG